jgi:hypothetical protein
VSGNRREFHFRHLADRQHAVYIVWRHDEPLYVGMTSNWWQRTGMHLNRFAGRVTHIDVWDLAVSRAEAEVYERMTIRDLTPTDNYVHTDRDQFRDRRLAS